MVSKVVLRNEISDCMFLRFYSIEIIYCIIKIGLNMIKNIILHMVLICEDSFGDRIAALYHNHYFTVYQKVASQCTSDIN